MRKFLTLLALVLVGFTVNAQSVNGVPLKDIDQTYVQIVGTSNMMGNKVKIQIDFGQENKYWSTKDTRMLDDDGNDIKFNSMIDALNFMNKAGYEFLTATPFH